ncbi:MAG: hypothetical protein ABIJ12_12265 [bacterium]
MSFVTEAEEKEFRKTKILAMAFLILAPLVYILLVSFVIKPAANFEPKQDFIFYILIIISISQPMAYSLIERLQVSNFKKTTITGMTTEKLYTTLSIIKFAFVESIYIYGLVDYILSGDKFHFLIFVVIGVCWSALVWPRRDKFESFLMKVKPYGQ